MHDMHVMRIYTYSYEVQDCLCYPESSSGFNPACAQGAGRIVTLRGKSHCSPRRWLERPIWRVNWVGRSGTSPDMCHKCPE